MPRESSASVRVFYPRYARRELVELLRGKLPALAAELPLGRVVLFGSWARGNHTAFSDIDLMVFYADPPRDDAYHVVRRAMEVHGLEPHVYSETQARGARRTLDRMMDGGVVLYPADDSGGPAERGQD